MGEEQSANPAISPEAMLGMWNQAKVKHLMSLGGQIQEVNQLSGLSADDLMTLQNDGIVTKDDDSYIECGNTLVKINNEIWNDFRTNCEDQMAEISKFMDSSSLLHGSTQADSCCHVATDCCDENCVACEEKDES